MQELKELEEFLKDEKNVIVFKDFVEKMGYETPDKIEGLKNKNLQVILNEKKLKEKIVELEKVVDSIDIDEYNALKNKTKGKDDNPDITKLQREIKTLTENLTKLSEEKKTTDTKYQNSFKMTKLNEALDANGFDPKHKSLLLSAFQGKAVIESDGANDLLIVDGGSLGQLPANDFFKKYSTSDEGKSYLRVPENSGVGRTNLQGNQSGRKLTLEQFNAIPAKDRSAFMAGGGQIIE